MHIKQEPMRNKKKAKYKEVFLIRKSFESCFSRALSLSHFFSSLVHQFKFHFFNIYELFSLTDPAPIY